MGHNLVILGILGMLVGLSSGLKCWTCDEINDDRVTCASLLSMADGKPQECSAQEICIKAVGVDISAGKEYKQLKCMYLIKEEEQQLLGKCTTSGKLAERKRTDFNDNVGNGAQFRNVTLCGCNTDGCNGAGAIGGRHAFVVAAMVGIVVALAPPVQGLFSLHG